VGIEEMQVDEENVNIRMGKATFKGPSQLNPLNPCGQTELYFDKFV
jgi:arabinoxylan arabinofuranohydrolase